MTQTTPSSGTPGIPFGRYELLHCLGAGGMGEVFVARLLGLHGFQKLVVVKVLLPHLGQDPEFIRMFLDEARIAAQLTHPNIAQLFDLGEHHGSYFLAMEFLHGEDLSSVAEAAVTHGGLPAVVAAKVVAEAARGLDYAHRAQDMRGRPLQVVHRDISPQNLFVTFDGQVKVIDFGIARAAGRQSSTQAGIVRGKAAYMSPEQATAGPLDGRADLFALGVVLYELLAGAPLFARETDVATLAAVLEGEIPPLPSTVAPQLAAVVERALAPDPEDRFQTGAELAQALDSFLASTGEGVALPAFMQQLFAERLAEERLSGRPYVTSRTVPSSLFADVVPPAGVEAEHEGNPLARLGIALGVAAVLALGLAGWRLAGSGEDAQPAGQLIVVTRPPGAAVSLNGRVMGASPLRNLDLDPGRVSVVEVSRPGFVTQRREVAPGTRATLEIDLEEVPLARAVVEPSRGFEPESSSQLERLTARALAEKDPGRAEALFREALASSPDDRGASTGLGLLLSRQPDRAREAIPFLLTSLRGRPQTTEVRTQVVACYAAVGDVDAGIQHYLLHPAPLDVPATSFALLRDGMIERGLRARDDKEHARARELLGAVVKREPTNYPVRLALAQVHEQLGQRAEAAKEYSACARGGPPGPLVREALRGLKDVEQGRLASTDPRLKAAQAERSPRRAEALYREVLAEQPDDVEVNRLLGLLVSSQPGREAEAIPLLLNGLRGNPRDEALRVRLIVGFTAAGRLDEAIRELLQTKKAVLPRDVFARLRGRLVEQGLRAQGAYEFENARSLLAPVAEREPRDFGVRLALGQVYEGLGDLRLAAAEYEACARGAPPGPIVREALKGLDSVKARRADKRAGKQARR